MNQFSLSASLIERSVMRYTPAGIPVATFELWHQGEILEAGVMRKIEYAISALAIGDLAHYVLTLEMGEVRKWSGFLARKNRNSKSLVFHITEIGTL